MPVFTKVFFMCVVLAGLITASAVAQDDTSGFVAFKATRSPIKENTLKIGIVPLLVGEIPYCGEIRIAYEHPIAHNQSILVGLSYNYPGALLLLASASSSGSGINDFSWRGGRLTLGYRWYPLKKSDAPKGFYVGPYFSGNFLKIRDKHDFTIYETMDYLNASVIVGEQVLAHNGFTFDVFGGVGYKNDFIAHSDPNFSVGILRPTDLVGLPNASAGLQHIKVTLQVNFGYSF